MIYDMASAVERLYAIILAEAHVSDFCEMQRSLQGVQAHNMHASVHSMVMVMTLASSAVVIRNIYL